MAIDVTGGFDEEREFVFATQPTDPEARESVNAWIWDDSGAFGIARTGVEAVADQWQTHNVQFNLAFADGRVYTLAGPGPTHDPLGKDGRARILGSGPLRFELVEPFRHLRMTYDGPALTTTAEAQIKGWMPAPGSAQVHVTADIDIFPAAPPWENGSTSDEARHILATQEEGFLIGYPWRFEQLGRARGTIVVGGETHHLDGGANRIRRQGVRRLASFWGHVWQAALFPSGRGFGFQVYPPRKDGKTTYNEGYVVDDGQQLPARVVRAPFLHSLEASGEDVTCVLETPHGTIEIGGETLMSTFMIMPPEVGGGMQLQQALARYRWDGESAVGMLERSSTPDRMD